MKTLDELRNQLKAIRTFYAHADKGKNVIAFDGIPLKDYKSYVYKVTALCDNLHWRLKDVYYGLYVYGGTQKRLADKWEVTEKYVQILHKRLLLALQPIMPDKPQKPVKNNRNGSASLSRQKWFGKSCNRKAKHTRRINN